MEDAGTAPARYSAFISYNHRDVGFAGRLQRRIENYRLPTQMRRAPGADPDRRGRLKPCFRDQAELTAAPDLAASVRAAIGESDYLVVICTPNGAGSEWVGREVALFRTLRGEGAVLAALFEGESAAAFHPSLLSTAADGTAIRPLAADFRPGGEGRRLALLKLVAVLAGVRLNDLVRRDAQRRLRQVIVAAAATAVVLVLIAVFATVALLARADARRTQARGVATVSRLVDQREQFKKAGRLELLQAHDRAALDFFKDQDVAALPPEAQLLSAKLLQGISEDDETAGDYSGMRRAALAALATTGPLLAAAPGDTDRIYAHAQSEYWIGQAALRQEDFPEVQRHFTGYARLIAQLVRIDPHRAEWQKEAGDADSDLGTFLFHQMGAADQAARLFESAQRHFQLAATIKPGDSEIEMDLADGYSWLADVARKKGDYFAALHFRLEAKRTLDDLQRRNPADAQIVVASIKNQLGLARLAALQHRWSDATALFEQGRSDARMRVLLDPTNADLKREVRAFDLYEVETWLSMPQKMRPALKRLTEVLGDCNPKSLGTNHKNTLELCRAQETKLRKTELN